ncbi:PucR family transcriptional regulator ligand-binding domain-containing protein [Bacillus shivajii]|uniref:PucR family transcriptional regulator n=1 Tax=Bacillus shivajii TaxID=1983719 RepID=UPI001CFC430F|nr:PucR family transcriptional regulator [Bacillus shivajii]UCZ51419.1 PucR family transcriptional regulator ligand-binding domain-containing protein [Bacillus shivajii]
MNSYLTIREILERKHFESIDIVAGIHGLERQVKWVHVVEVIQIKKLLNGNELILTTGLGWKTDRHLFRSLIEQLIESHAAGLCLEMGTHTTTVPQEIIDVANEHHFPIILFKKEVPFVEITQDIHSLLINKQYQMISNLEDYSQQLNKKLLDIEDAEDILKLLQETLEVQVIAHFNENELKAVPHMHEDDMNKFIEIENIDFENSSQVARQPVQILGNQYAELMILSYQRELNDFDYLLLDRTATALAQHLLRNLFVEEKKRMEESEWMIDWLEGHHSEHDIREYISYHKPKLQYQGGIVCVCEFHSEEKTQNMDRTYFKLFFRTIFEQHGFYIYTAEVRHKMIFILVNQREKPTWKERMTKGFTRIENDDSGKLDTYNISFGVGKFVPRLRDIDKSYQAAKETLQLQKRLSNESRRYFYDDLHLYRIISLINKHGDLQETVMEYLKPVIDYDKKHHASLMETLKTYLACNGSKQETAKKLFVVRQTLYHRIDKLEKILGQNFMSPERRLTIEFMTVAYDYLKSLETEPNH